MNHAQTARAANIGLNDEIERFVELQTQVCVRIVQSNLDDLDVRLRQAALFGRIMALCDRFTAEMRRATAVVSAINDQLQQEANQ